MNDGDIFEVPAHPGLHFRVHIESDRDHGTPWENEDGHGPVRCINSNTAKRSGERLLNDYGGGKWLYDWQAACKLARKDGWNAEPFDAPNRIERAVQADFDRLRRFLQDDWWYVGVRVGVVTPKGVPLTDTCDLWGIESDCDDYIKEVAHELAAEAGEAYNAAFIAEQKATADAADMALSASRWYKLRDIVKTKDLGTEFDEQGKPHSPQFRRWYIDTAVNLLTLDAAIDSLKDGS